MMRGIFKVVPFKIGKVVFLIMVFMSTFWSLQAESHSFSMKPIVQIQKGKVVIEFAVQKYIDVTVNIEDGNGNIICHLVSGMLGVNAPKPLQSSSLTQKLIWDRKDDQGKIVSKIKNLKVKVMIGLKPDFVKMIGDVPGDMADVRGMAMGADGKLYVFQSYGASHPHDDSTVLCVFNKKGKYEKTIMPYAASLPDKSLKGLNRISLPNGKKVPFVYQFETRSYLPGLGNLPINRFVVRKDNMLGFIGIQEGPRPFANPGEARLTVIGADGSVPKGGALKTLLTSSTDTAASLALSPDEKIIYATGLRLGKHVSLPGKKIAVCNLCDGKGHGLTWKCSVQSNAVYAFGWDDDKAKVIIGSEKGISSLNNPVSVDTDSEGNIYVADLLNNRIAIFSARGVLLGQIKVKDPQRVEVHKKTSAVYVLSGQLKMDLIKFDHYKTGKEILRTRLIVRGRRFSPIRRPLIVLDDSSETPLIYASYPFCRIEDLGDTFGPLRYLRPKRKKGNPNSIGPVMELSFDKKSHQLYINNHWTYHTKKATWEKFGRPTTGSKHWRTMWPKHSTFSSAGRIGQDGNYYQHVGSHRALIYRYTADMKPLPFEKLKTAENKLSPNIPIVGYARSYPRGVTADEKGNVYAIWKKHPRVKGDYHRAQVLDVYDNGGQLIKKNLIDSAIPGIGSIRLDSKGNMYLAVAIRPGKDILPSGLQGRISNKAYDDISVNKLNGYPLMYGSIVKFSPKGGVIRKGVDGELCNFGNGNEINVKGADWIYSGVSTVPSWATPKGKPGSITVCLCESANFDVDAYGRSFFPDAGRCRVGVLDSSGNKILDFGSYANRDSEGGGSSVGNPKIPLCWPQAVAVGNGHVFIGDRLNRRVVQVKLNYSASAQCKIE